jgi:hypothetical protein
MQLNIINDTYMTGFEALTISLARLEERVDVLEELNGVHFKTGGQDGTGPIDRS